MIDKIKQWLSSAKQAILFIFLPLSALIGYILLLRGKNQQLETKLEETQTNEEIIKSEDKESVDEKEANDLEAQFNQLNAELNQSQPSGEPKSDSEPKS